MGKANESRAYETALELARKEGRDDPKVVALLKEAHKNGDARATYGIATWYLHGTKRIKKNWVAAVRYLREAAEAGISNAMYDLAVCYEKGAGVEADPKAAFEYYLRAALHGEEESVFEVSRCYHWGIGVRKDHRVADIWADRAEELGVIDQDRDCDESGPRIEKKK